MIAEAIGKALADGPARAAGRRPRAGIILPMVLVVMTAVAGVTLSLLAVTARQLRVTRLRWDMQQAVTLADAAVVRGLADWTPDRVAATPIGVLRDTVQLWPEGWITHQRIMRTGPLMAVVDASAERRRGTAATTAGDPRDPWTVRRRVARVVWLQPPALPLPAAVTVLGGLTLAGAAIDGRDQPASNPEPADDCGAHRDTASRAAVAARAITGNGERVQGERQALSPAQLGQAWTTLQVAQPLLLTRLRAHRALSGGRLPEAPHWQGQQLGAPGLVSTLTGDADIRGLLLIDGDLVITGTLHLDGLLVVRGRLDASEGRLLLHGQLLVADPAGHDALLGPGTAVRYNPCLVGRALAAIAQPRPEPFFSWNTP